MSVYGNLTIGNATKEKLKIQFDVAGRKKHKKWDVSAESVKRKSVRIDRSDRHWNNYKRKCWIFIKASNRRIFKKKIKFRATIAHETALTVDKIGGNYRVTVSEPFSEKHMKLFEQTHIAEMKNAVVNGLGVEIEPDYDYSEEPNID